MRRSNRPLADVNVLLALLFEAHADHSRARAWFGASASEGWATNAITQIGVVRLLTMRAVTNSMISARTALTLVRDLTSDEAHEFWPLDQSCLKALGGFANRITGHGQWTDALLLSHVIARDGVLVTFDRGVAALAGEHRARVTVLE